MKNKFVVLSLLTGIFAVGCAEQAYTPNNGLMPNTGMNFPQNNMYPNNMYPNNVPQNNWNNIPNMNPLYQPYAQQNMLSLNMRLRTPGFYFTPYAYSTCIPRPRYQTSCNQRVVRSTCTTVVVKKEEVNSTSNDPIYIGGGVYVNRDGSSVTTGTQTTTDTDHNTETTNVYPISWKDGDAQALYQRLAKEEETVEKRTLKADVKARTGQNIKCIVDGRENRAESYVCDLEIRAKDGMLLAQANVGKDAAPEIADEGGFLGNLLRIGARGNVRGETPETGYLTIAGPVAKLLYADLNVEAVDGKVAEANDVDASIKTLGQIKCYKTKNTTKTKTECVLKIETNTGKALNF